jgi:very-short-patch-repair endonuclease
MSLRQDGADGMYKKRFNVASSRAKDQLWVVYSIDAQTQLKPNDIRRRLIEHAIDPSSLMNQLNAGLVKTESPFEAEVFKILSGNGYRITPQWQVGAYRIDMVAEGNGKRLAIECDGERWHYDKAEEDLARQALLERLGWTFVRIRGSVFYRDKTAGRQIALMPLFQRLKDIGIEPYHELSSPEAGNGNQTLADEVKQKASEIRFRNASSLEMPTSIEATIQPIEIIEVPSDSLVFQGHKPISILPSQPELIEAEVQVPLFNQPFANQSLKPSSQTSILPVKFVRGDRVFNEKFGLGTVIGVKQFGGQIRELVIEFDYLPESKTLVASAVQLA